jgi:hypothetical protein
VVAETRGRTKKQRSSGHLGKIVPKLKGEKTKTIRNVGEVSRLGELTCQDAVGAESKEASCGDQALFLNHFDRIQ